MTIHPRIPSIRSVYGAAYLNGLPENEYPRHFREGGGDGIDVLGALKLVVESLQTKRENRKGDKRESE